MLNLKNILLCLGLIFSTGVAHAAEWELAKDADNIKVFTAVIAGSDYKAFRGETIINAELNQLMAVLDDTANFVQWMYNCKAPKLLYKASLLDRYQYLQNDFPWPAKDREMILRNEISQDPQSRVTTVKLSSVVADKLPAAAQQSLPSVDGVVRMGEVNGFFELTPLDAIQTKVVFQLHLDPGGGLPSGLVNSQIVDNPYETLKALRTQVARPKYANFNPF
ncbi:START domain-containing protein [Zhongshania guokunii]|uniref:START domain-containing protein n=1 Tax=Zhongshania guokunii TaxID=641783 RepID=A0ABV3U125_9GAMM